MADPLAFGAEYVLGKVIDAAMDLAGSSMSFDEARKKAGGETAFEVELAWQRHFKLLSDEVKARLAQSVDEREVVAIFHKLLPATVEATTQSRMKMLAAALAGVWTPDFSAEMRGRVARAVVELEPSDILALRRAMAEAAASENHMQMNPAYEGLFRVGCIAPQMQMAHVGVTSLGQAVLTALRNWT